MVGRLDLLFKKAKVFGEKNGLGVEAEDFAQECLIRTYRAKKPINVNYVWLDYRETFRSDKRILSAPEGPLSGFLTISLETPTNGDDFEISTLADTLGARDEDLERAGEVSLVRQLLDQPPSINKQISLWHLCGLTLNEMAKELKISEVAVCQRSKKVKLALNEMVLAHAL